MSKRREWWIDPDPCDEEMPNVFDAFSEHPGQGPLLWQSRLVRVQEIKPGEVVISRDELRAALSKGSYCNDGSTDWQVVERELFGEEPGAGGEV